MLTVANAREREQVVVAKLRRSEQKADPEHAEGGRRRYRVKVLHVDVVDNFVVLVDIESDFVDVAEFTLMEVRSTESMQHTKRELSMVKNSGK